MWPLDTWGSNFFSVCIKNLFMQETKKLYRVLRPICSFSPIVRLGLAFSFISYYNDPPRTVEKMISSPILLSKALSCDKFTKCDIIKRYVKCTVKFLKGIIECQEYLSQKKFFVALDTHDLNYD